MTAGAAWFEIAAVSRCELDGDDASHGGIRMLAAVGSWWR
jgi:hypothetical protein